MLNGLVWRPILEELSSAEKELLDLLRRMLAVDNDARDSHADQVDHTHIARWLWTPSAHFLKIFIHRNIMIKEQTGNLT